MLKKYTPYTMLPAYYSIKLVSETAADIAPFFEHYLGPNQKLGPREIFSNTPEYNHITGTEADENIFGTDGDDAIGGGGGNDVIYGFDGDDFLYATVSNNASKFQAIYGGDGNDTIQTGDGDDFISGGNGDDEINSNGGSDIIFGGDGNDKIYVRGSDNFIDGGAGNDFIYAALTGAGTILGGEGNDEIYAGAGKHFIDGGSGGDSIILGSSNDRYFQAVSVDLERNLVLNDGYGYLVNITNFESISISGASQNNILLGSQQDDHLKFYNDAGGLIDGRAGDDVIIGGEFDDILIGGAGNDRLYGDGLSRGTGQDVFVFGGLWGQDSVWYLGSNDVLFFKDLDNIEQLIIHADGNNRTLITLRENPENYILLAFTDPEDLILENFRFRSDVPDDIIITDIVTQYINENHSGTIVQVNASDGSDGLMFYSIANGQDGEHFRINSQTGELDFIIPPDYETPTDFDGNNVYIVDVTATNGFSTSSTRVYANVLPLDETPVYPESAGDVPIYLNLEVQENTGGVFHNFRMIDPEGSLVTYYLGGQDANRFRIDAETGNLSFITPPNWESPNSYFGTNTYQIDLMASDGNQTTTQRVNISVEDQISEDPLSVATHLTDALIALNSKISGLTDAENIKLIKALGNAMAVAGLGFDTLRAIDRLGEVPRTEFRKQAYIEGGDFIIKAALVAGGIFAGPTFLAAIAITGVSYVYTTRMESYVRESLADYYDERNGASQVETKDIFQFLAKQDELLQSEILIEFDSEYYLNTYTDAQDAVNAGTYANAYLHYLSVGVHLGYFVNASEQTVNVDDLAIEVLEGASGVGYQAGLFSTALGQYRGDGLSVSETEAADAVQQMSTLGDAVLFSADLTAVANRVIRDLLFHENLQIELGSSQINPDLSDQLSLSEHFGSNMEGVTIFTLVSPATTIESLMLELQSTHPDMFTMNYAEMGIAQYGNLWVFSAQQSISSSVAALINDIEMDNNIASSDDDVINATPFRSLVAYGLEGADSIFGGAQNDALYGGAGNDNLHGLAGNDFIHTGSGFDLVYAGDGNDEVMLGSGGSIVELGAGDDLVRTSSYSDDIIHGGDGNDIIDSGLGEDTIYGDVGNDAINGGSGLDLMYGGLGDDTFIVDNSLDTIVEYADEGIDTVYAFAAYTLTDNVEIGVSLITDSAVSMSGNNLDNILILSSQAGGNAVDGGGGNDTIYVQSNTVAIGSGGNDVLVLLGNGNFAIGGTGDDTYILSGTNSAMAEYEGGGFDTVYSYQTNITLGDNIETLALIGGDINGTGNDQNNSIIGTAGNNALIGAGGSDYIVAGAGNDYIAGGTGLDVMQGNSGFDVFIYGALSEAGDIILDWNGAEDSFLFGAAAFGFAPGQSLVDGGNFFSGDNPYSLFAQATFLWDSDDTALYYDADGSGAGAAILIADVQAFTDVGVSDFVFF